MSISYNIKREGIADSIDIPGTEISAYLLQKLLAQKLKVKQNELTLFNAFTGLKLNPLQNIKDKSSVVVQRLFKSQTKLNSTGIVTNQQLAEMGRKARFFMIKSSNEENIQKARQFSVWATTYANQDRLRSALLYTPHVFLLFATNRSYEIKGLARMEKEPTKVSEKAFWAGVNNIRLGGNFEIKWIRKQPLTSLQIEKALGTQFKDRVMRLSDGEQIDSELAQKLILLFQIPTQPYYAVKQEQPQNKTTDPVKKVLGLGKILQSTKQATIAFPIPIPFPIPHQNLKSSQEKQKIFIQTKQYRSDDRQKQQKKEKSKKYKHRSSSEQSSSSSSYSSDSSSSSSISSRSRKEKKIKKEKKAKRQKNEKKQKKKQRRRRRSHTPSKKKSKKEKKKNHKKSRH